MLIKFFQTHVIMILFELTIFILLVIQVTQIVKQFLTPFLREQIAAFNTFVQNLNNKLSLTKKTEQRLNKSIKDQTVVLQNLEAKIKNWHTALVEKENTKAAKQGACIEKLKIKRQKQYETLMAKKEELHILPAAIAQAAKQLKETYASKEGKKILSKVIEKL